MDYRQRVTGDEKDYLDPKSRRHFSHRAGARRAVRQGLNRRVRRGVRSAIRSGREV